MQNSLNLSRTTGWLRGAVLVTAFAGLTAVAHPAFSQTDTVKVEGRKYRETIELRGTSVHGFQVTEIRAKLGGYVKSIGVIDGLEVDIGSLVKQGDVLAVLDIPEMQNELVQKNAIIDQTNSAVIQADAAILETEAFVIQSAAALDQVRSRTAEKEAMVKLNETKMERLSRLAAGGTIGQDSLDEARYEVAIAKAALVSVQADVRAATANIQAAEASVARAKADKVSAEAKVAVARSAVDHLNTMMDYMTIRAPYDAVVTMRMVDIGSYVQPAENNSAAMSLFQLTQISRVRIMVAVPNNNVAKVEPGQEVVFDSIGGLEGRAFSGKVTRTAGALDLKTRTMPIEVHLDNPAVDSISGNKVQLKPGLYGTLTIVLRVWNSDSPLPVVPTTAVGRDTNGNSFVVIVEDGKPARRRVEIAFDDATSVGISSGLNVGDTVVRSGVSRY